MKLVLAASLFHFVITNSESLRWLQSLLTTSVRGMFTRPTFTRREIGDRRIPSRDRTLNACFEAESKKLWGGLQQVRSYYHDIRQIYLDFEL